MNQGRTGKAPRRALLLVVDSLGIGALPDAAHYGDAGADTFHRNLELDSLESILNVFDRFSTPAERAENCA